MTCGNVEDKKRHGQELEHESRSRKRANPTKRLAALLETDELTAVNDTDSFRNVWPLNMPRAFPQVTAHLVGAGRQAACAPCSPSRRQRLCGYDGPYHVHLAATVEFIHTATLLHDDVVDESAQRRGRPTANLLWDNKSSVLVGDYLCSLARSS